MRGPCMCGSPDCHSCSGGQSYDETLCVSCHARLPEDPEPDTWPYEGFCNAACLLKDAVARAKWPDDGVHRCTRKAAERALKELSETASRAEAAREESAQPHPFLTEEQLAELKASFPERKAAFEREAKEAEEQFRREVIRR